MKKGIDISYHQGDIDFSRAKEDIDFIIPRDGWGTSSIDPKLVEYVQKAQTNGISVTGVYHFVYALNAQQVIQNANQAVKNVQAAGLPKSTVIWCDIEYDTVENAKKWGITLTPKILREYAESFCNYILAQGYPTGIYCNKDYLVNIYGTDIMDDYDIWLADLEGELDYPCVYRQYDWHGKPDGCPEEVDLDEYIGSYTAGTAKPKGGSMIYRKVYSESQLKIILKTLARSKSSYKAKAPWNLLYWDGSRWWADCVNLYKALFNGRDIINPRPESWQNNLTNTGDCTEWGLMQQCEDVSTDFKTLGNKFECLYMDDMDEHFGGYLGEEWNEPGQGIVNCVEATPAWEDGIQFSYVDAQGRRFWCKGGSQRGTWTCHGLATPWIDYAKDPEPEPTPEIKETKISMETFISYLPWIQKGSKGETVTLLQNCLKTLGYYTDTVDGSAGPNTEKAMKAYQKDVGLYPDGIFGTKSWAKILPCP